MTTRPGADRDALDEDDDLEAGGFGAWLVEIEAAIAGDQGSDVACGTCTACCTSSQFVHIAPDEADTLAHVAPELTFPAPGLPPGHVLLGYDERGHCPMLVDGACSIYAHRPRTCRTYDCRVFAAADVEPDATKVLIARRAARWRFTLANDADRARLAAVRAAAAIVQARPSPLDDLDVSLPESPTLLAVLAVEIHAVFLRYGDGGPELIDPDPAVVAEAVRRARDAHRAG